MTVLPAAPVPVRTSPVRVVYGRVRARRSALVKPPIRVVWWLVVAALVRALYGRCAHSCAPGSVRVRAGGAGRYAYAAPSGVRGPATVPGAYPGHGRVFPARYSWIDRAKVVRGPGRRRGGGRDAAWVRVPAPYPARTWPGQAGMWWYMPGVARAGRVVDGRRVKYRRVHRTLPSWGARHRSRARAGGRRKPRHMSGEHGRIFRALLAFRDGPRCFYCRAPFADPSTEATFDHYLPSALWLTGRHNAPWNLVLACDPCNGAKGDRLPWPLVWLLLARFRPAVGVLAAAA
ncbi:hypothetical protein GCM10022419_008200 [Nonomuraea rosea]|uniref:HNH domain-containing protein n=1 Tax=Nonomuraea rosea TaxID=638574 RepID=A0ABP6VAN3_9ACTN